MIYSYVPCAFTGFPWVRPVGVTCEVRVGVCTFRSLLVVLCCVLWVLVLLWCCLLWCLFCFAVILGWLCGRLVGDSVRSSFVVSFSSVLSCVGTWFRLVVVGLFL